MNYNSSIEPKYKRVLTDKEIIEIAENLSGLVELVLKFKHRETLQKK